MAPSAECPTSISRKGTSRGAVSWRGWPPSAGSSCAWARETGCCRLSAMCVNVILSLVWPRFVSRTHCEILFFSALPSATYHLQEIVSFLRNRPPCDSTSTRIILETFILSCLVTEAGYLSWWSATMRRKRTLPGWRAFPLPHRTSSSVAWTEVSSSIVLVYDQTVVTSTRYLDKWKFGNSKLIRSSLQSYWRLKSYRPIEE